MSALLIYDEDEQSLAEGARDWADTEHPISRFRALRDSGKTWDPAVWQELVELGWPAVGLPVEADGMGLTARVILCEALGRSLAGTPLISAWLAADLDPEADSAQGEVRALAFEEKGTRADPNRVSARVLEGKLSGDKLNVLDAAAATGWLVSAREGGSVGVYRVAREHGQVTPLARVDHRDAASVRFDNAPCTRIGELTDLQRALDHAALATSAEMLGGMLNAFETTLAYVKERQQFGVAIGSFQVIKHRMVDCFIQIELCRSAVLAGAREPTVAHIALAKALCGDTYSHVAREAIQFHGGIGVTDECDVGFHLKRARVADRLFGTAAWQRQRWAKTHGY